jgi:hypothetical protein
MYKLSLHVHVRARATSTGSTRVYVQLHELRNQI